MNEIAVPTATTTEPIEMSRLQIWAGSCVNTPRTLFHEHQTRRPAAHIANNGPASTATTSRGRVGRLGIGNLLDQRRTGGRSGMTGRSRCDDESGFEAEDRDGDDDAAVKRATVYAVLASYSAAPRRHSRRSDFHVSAT
jgi:hypothetical protein